MLGPLIATGNHSHQNSLNAWPPDSHWESQSPELTECLPVITVVWTSDLRPQPARTCTHVVGTPHACHISVDGHSETCVEDVVLLDDVVSVPLIAQCWDVMIFMCETACCASVVFLCRLCKAYLPPCHIRLDFE